MPIPRYFCCIFLFLLVVSCRKDTTISVTDYEFDYPANLAEYLHEIDVPLDNPMTKEGVELGRKLFYDNILSGDGTMSCASCHDPKHSFTDEDRFSEGITGEEGTRNSMPLVNLGWSKHFFWDGRAGSLEEQGFGPVVNPIEMNNTWPKVVADLQAHNEYPLLFRAAFNTAIIDSTLVVKALAQFERTLISGNAPFDKIFRNEPSGYTPAEESLILAGYDIFRAESDSVFGGAGADCIHCHGDVENPLWTDDTFHNNGLDEIITDIGYAAVTGNPKDIGKFKTPTLRNLMYSAPYMHDGRFETLSEVIDHYSFGLHKSPTIDPLMKNVDIGGVQLSPDQKQKLLLFLESLSEPGFRTKPEYQKP